MLAGGNIGKLSKKYPPKISIISCKISIISCKRAAGLLDVSWGATEQRKLYIRDSRNGLPARRGLILKLQILSRNIFTFLGETDLFAKGLWWNTFDDTSWAAIFVRIFRQSLWDCLNDICKICKITHCWQFVRCDAGGGRHRWNIQFMEYCPETLNRIPNYPTQERYFRRFS